MANLIVTGSQGLIGILLYYTLLKAAYVATWIDNDSKYETNKYNMTTIQDELEFKGKYEICQEFYNSNI